MSTIHPLQNPTIAKKGENKQVNTRPTLFFDANSTDSSINNTSSVSEISQAYDANEGEDYIDNHTNFNYNNKDWIQYTLPIPNTKSNLITQTQNWYNRWRRRELELQLMPIWRGAAFSLAMATSIMSGPGLLLYSAILFNRIGASIPLLYNPRSNGVRWEQADKIMLLIIPAVITIALIFVLRLIYKTFNQDKRFATLLSWLIILFNGLTLVAAIQIYSLSAK